MLYNPQGGIWKVKHQSHHMTLTLSNPFLQIAPPTPSLKNKVSGCNEMRWTCRKKDIHPQFYEDAKVYCNGELVMTTGGTKKEYIIDVWSGNHQFYLGSRSTTLLDDDQVEKFRRKYGGLGSMIMEIPTLKGELVLPPRKKNKVKKK